MTSWTPPSPRRWRLLRRHGPWLRRGLALMCLALAALTAGAAKPAADPAPSIATLVTTHAVLAGATLAANDVTLQPWPSAVRPASAVGSAAGAIGRRVSSAMSAGEAVTTTRLIDPATWNLSVDQSAAAITLADESGGSLLHAGDVIDLIAGSGSDDALSSVGSEGAVAGGSAAALGSTAARGPSASGSDAVVADGVTVLQVLPVDSGAASSGHSTQIVVGVNRQTAIRLAATLGVPMLATVHRRP